MRRFIMAGLLALGLCGAASAQSSDAAKPATDVGSQGGTLSEKLSSTGGVIHPTEQVDPKMQKPAPSTGNTPVIPAPGSPGSDPDVQPK